MSTLEISSSEVELIRYRYTCSSRTDKDKRILKKLKNKLTMLNIQHN